MNNFNIKMILKILFFILWIAFGGISCWATASSFQLNFPSWNFILTWVLAVGFYVCASFGSLWFVESFREYCPNHRIKFWGGLSILIIFWLFFGMTTNTHKFFYDRSIALTVNDDIATTRVYLKQVMINAGSPTLIRERNDSIGKEVTTRLISLRYEMVENDKNPGLGEKSREILDGIYAILGVKSEYINAVANTKSERQALFDLYRNRILDHLAANQEAYELAHKIDGESGRTNAAKAREIDDKLKTIQEKIEVGSIRLDNVDDMNPAMRKGVVQNLGDAYSIVRNNKDFVKFKSEEDRTIYMGSDDKNVSSKTSSVFSVYNVWKDFLAGKYDSSYIWLVLLALLIDIAGFLFFYLAFK